MPSTRQTAPCGRRICPAVSERSKCFPSIRGALQRLRVRAQSQTQAAFGLSGSISLWFHSCQPQEKTEPSPTSFATCFDRERLPLHDLVPGRGGLEAVAAADSLVAQEAEHEAHPVRRDPDRREIRDRVAVALPQEPVAEDRTERPDLGGRQVDLADDVGDLRHRAPPRDRVVLAGVGRLVDQQDRVRALRREVLQEREHVRAVLRGRRAPRRRDRRAEQLVLDDERRRAAPGSLDGPLYSPSAAASIVEGSAGALGAPTFAATSGRRRRSPRRGPARRPRSRCGSASWRRAASPAWPGSGGATASRTRPTPSAAPDAALPGEHRVRGRAAGREQAGRRNDWNEQEDPLHDQLLCTRDSSGPESPPAPSPG